jgi:hypothetical protein
VPAPFFTADSAVLDHRLAMQISLATANRVDFNKEIVYHLACVYSPSFQSEFSLDSMMEMQKKN